MDAGIEWGDYGRAVARACWALRRYGIVGGAAQEMAHDATTTAWEKGARGVHMARYAALAALGLARDARRQAGRYRATEDMGALAACSPVGPDGETMLGAAMRRLPPAPRAAVEAALASGGVWQGGAPARKIAAMRARRALRGLVGGGS